MTKAISSNETCFICSKTFPNNIEVKQERHFSLKKMQEIPDGDLTPTQTKCSHIFHTACLKNWITSSIKNISQANCPACNAVLLETPGTYLIIQGHDCFFRIPKNETQFPYPIAHGSVLVTAQTEIDPRAFSGIQRIYELYDESHVYKFDDPTLGHISIRFEEVNDN